MTSGARFVWIVLSLIGLYDLAVGAWLLTAAEPWRAHGPDTLWQATPELLAQIPASTNVFESLYRRMGAFSLHAGAVTVVWAFLARSNRPLRTALLVTYTLTGLGFGYTDGLFFAGTAYAQVKHLIGGLWVAALIVHFTPPVRAWIAKKRGR